MKNKGITLVALVITIIILLILAGIAISQLTESGLFENSKLAQKKYENAQSYEIEQLDKYANSIEDYVSGNRDYAEEIRLLKAKIEQLENKRTVTKLWEYDSSAANSSIDSGLIDGTITLSDNINNYDEISVIGQYCNSSKTAYEQAIEMRILKENYDAPTNSNNWQFVINFSIDSDNNGTRRLPFAFKDGNKVALSEHTNVRLLKICGIKY